MMITAALRTGLCLVLLTASVAAQDAGIPDTLRVNDDTLYVGVSSPVGVAVSNDYDVWGMVFALVSRTVDGGFARYDSVAFVNRMADPSVIGLRIPNPRDTNGVSPDTTSFGLIQHGPCENPLQPGSDVIMLYYMTGLQPGTMEIDSGWFPPGNEVVFVPDCPCPDYWRMYTPVVDPGVVTILEGGAPPTVTVPGDWTAVAVGDEVSFEVQGFSPDELPVTLSLVDVAGYDDDTQEPAGEPSLSSGNPAQFSWVIQAGDVGVWLATFRACDTTGKCGEAQAVIQVAESESYLVAFDMRETSDFAFSTGLKHGNFDSDGNPEIAVSGYGHFGTPTLGLYDYAQLAGYAVADTTNDYKPARRLQVGYFNGDSFLDVVLAKWRSGPYYVSVWLGDGNNGLTLHDEVSGVSGAGLRASVLGEFNGDQYLDYAVTQLSAIRIFKGVAGGSFAYQDDVSTGDPALSLNSADLNGDGYDDFIVGTEDMIRLYLNDGTCHFTAADSFWQTYGVVDIEVTNQGSDFNGDNHYDLCVATPSVGGATSDLVVYLGDGAGSFTQASLATVQGQAFATCPADINGDGHLDIVYSNGSRRYVAVLYGNGDGTFYNEVKYRIPQFAPSDVDCLDADLDGDIDIVVVSSDPGITSKLYLLENQNDPTGFTARLVEVTGTDNSALELSSPTGKVLNKVQRSMPASGYYLRDVDENEHIDDFATVGVVESGTYQLTASPKPNVPPSETFSLELCIGGEPYRFALEAPMSPLGYQFEINPAGEPPVRPAPGKFIGTNPPTFQWQGAGTFDFQLAADIEFTEVLISEAVAVNYFTPSAPLPVADTTLFYWRVKPTGQPAYESLYPLSIMSECCTAVRGNINGDIDDAVNIVDLTHLVAYLFASGTEPPCPDEADVNADGLVNIVDLTYLVAYLFNEGLPPEPCP